MFNAADGYERFIGRWSRALADAFVDFAEVGAGERVLDVGAGTGSLALAVLEHAQAARVVGLEPSADFIGFARARLGPAYAGRAWFEQGDAQRVPFANATFDKAISQFVMNFVPDRQSTLREMIRVTKSSGVVAAAVWDYGDGMCMLRAFWDEAIALDRAADPKDERHMPLCRGGELAAFWRSHGLGDVREEPLVVTMAFASFEDYWLPFLAGQGPAGAYAAALPADQRQRLEEGLRRRLLGDQDDGPIRLAARAWAVRGVVPT